MGQPEVAPDYGMMPDRHTAEDRRIRINRDMVLHDRMTGLVDRTPLKIVGEVLCTEGHSLVECDMVSDDAGLADHNSCTVVDCEILAYAGSRMDVDTGSGMRQLGHDAGNHRNAENQKGMSRAIMKHGLDYRIAGDDLAQVLYCRVIVLDCLYIGIEETLDFSKLFDETAAELFGALVAIGLIAECKLDLASEKEMKKFQFGAEIGRRAEETREYNGFDCLYDFFHFVDGHADLARKAVYSLKSLYAFMY